MFEDDPSAESYDAYGKFYPTATHVFSCIDDQFESDAARKEKVNKRSAAKNAERQRARRLRLKLLHASKPK